MQYQETVFNKISIKANYLPEILLIMAIGVLGRLIPHLPNITPIVGLCLFAAVRLPVFLSCLVIVVTIFLSDLSLTMFFGYPLFGYFSLFTYSGFVFISFVATKLQISKRSLPLLVLGSSAGFWLWSNFGVWLASGLYANSFAGLVSCYYMALPFLGNALIGDLIWSYIILGSFYMLLRAKAKASNKGESSDLFHFN